jgi:hypothetical protein
MDVLKPLLIRGVRGAVACWPDCGSVAPIYDLGFGKKERWSEEISEDATVPFSCYTLLVHQCHHHSFFRRSTPPASTWRTATVTSTRRQAAGGSAIRSAGGSHSHSIVLCVDCMIVGNTKLLLVACATANRQFNGHFEVPRLSRVSSFR